MAPSGKKTRFPTILAPNWVVLTIYCDQRKLNNNYRGPDTWFISKGKYRLVIKMFGKFI